MTAPTRTRRQSPGETRQRARQRVTTLPKETPGTTRTERNTRGQRTSAAERAYARRAQRVEELQRSAEQPERVRKLRLRWPTSRASFVLIVMLLLAAGVVTTLLLSTQAIADSYRLEQVRQGNANLAERSEQLQQDVTKADSASALANRAKALGMVQGGDPAHLVQNADGSVTVVGEPQKVTAPAPPATPAPVTTQPAAGTPPIEGDVPQGEQPEVPAQTGGQ